MYCLESDILFQRRCVNSREASYLEKKVLTLETCVATHPLPLFLPTFLRCLQRSVCLRTVVLAQERCVDKIEVCCLERFVFSEKISSSAASMSDLIGLLGELCRYGPDM